LHDTNFAKEQQQNTRPLELKGRNMQYGCIEMKHSAVEKIWQCRVSKKHKNGKETF
jgi:hypothetical protein